MKERISRTVERAAAALRGLGGNARTAPDQALRYPPLAEDLAIYVIGDLHGRHDCLRAAHRRIDADRAQRRRRQTLEVYLGDYVDRGPDSSRVIETLIRRGATRPCRFLRGNHERVMSEFLAGRLDLEAWRKMGGYETILSYGQDPRHLANAGAAAAAMFLRQVPADHRAFLDGLCNAFAHGDYFFAHAGVRPGIALDAQEEQDLLWIRDPFLHADRDLGAIVIHGHSPVPEPELHRNRINIDTGAYATGRLTIACLDPDGVTILTVHAREARD